MNSPATIKIERTHREWWTTAESEWASAKESQQGVTLPI